LYYLAVIVSGTFTTAAKAALYYDYYEITTYKRRKSPDRKRKEENEGLRFKLTTPKHDRKVETCNNRPALLGRFTFFSTLAK